MEGMVFHAFHGCLESERTDGNTFSVDIRAEFDAGTAGLSDRLEDTVDYSLIYDIVSKEMSIPSNLLENVATRILNAVSYKFPELDGLSVRVSKKNPPVDGHCEWSRITVRKQ